MAQLNALPSALGFRVPAEWERHEATWLAWPHDSETWPEGLPELEAIYVEMVAHLHRGEKIKILVDGERMQDHVFEMLARRALGQNVSIHTIETDSVWIRDYGPVFLSRKGELALLNFAFNAWGKKYEAFENDNRVPERLASILGVRQFPSSLVLEGGAVEVNGRGTCLTTEQCLLNPNRNASRTRQEMEQCLNDLLGVRHVIWLEGGLASDDTDGHIDEVARFVAPGTVVAALEWNAHSQDFTLLKRNWERLSGAVDQDGKRLTLVTLPMPEPVPIEAVGTRRAVPLPASYANFYIGNDAVLVPVFNRRSDRIALGILKDLFPDRDVVGINAIPLILGLGAIHCVTQQEPARFVSP